MDEFSNRELPNIGMSFARLGSEATRHLCEQGQSFAHAIGEWNTELGHFLSHRMARNQETVASMAKCENLQDVLSVQTKWFQEASDDYLREFGKLIEANGKFVGDAFKPVAAAAVQAVERTTSPTAKVPMKI
jgi:hypothetical protein